MNKEATAGRFSTLNKDNRALRVILIGSVLVNVVLACTLFFKSEIVTIIPANVMTKASYTANGADEEALSSWGLYLAQLIGNVTPATADFTSNTVGKLLSPSIYKSVMEGIDLQVTKIKTEQLTLKFDAAEIKFNAAKNAVFVNGWLTTTDSHGTSQREERTYEIYFDVVNYQPRVVGLTSYIGKPNIGK